MRLSPREMEVARLVVQSATNKQIAAMLSISERQVESHVSRIVARWELDRSKNLRVQIVHEYGRRFGFPRLRA